jgi:hypothetical protein
MKSSAPTFEVRCAHCDVTFPVETRRCIHCGRAIHSRDQGGALVSIADSDWESGWESGGLLGGLSGVEPGVEPSVESDRETGVRSPKPIDVMSNPVEHEGEVPDEPSSIGRSIIRSLGGFIWVIVLIGFTLARNCGGNEP